MSFHDAHQGPAPSSDTALPPDDYAAQQAMPAPKNSISHPINISWIVPPEYLPLLALGELPGSIDLFDLTDPEVEKQLAPHFQPLSNTESAPVPALGNLALSSCPGKKVRLNGPVKGRASINRDLDIDFARMRLFGITTIVCCLDDGELEFLGATWAKYEEAAARNAMHVVRLPMVEGSCPETIEQVDTVVRLVNEKIKRGEHVLTHCRGGVGRAGLFACCWLLNNLLCLSAERAIRYIRLRRSPKAIETMRQAEFIIHYSQHIGRRLDYNRPSQRQTTPPDMRPTAEEPLRMTHTGHILSVPSVSDISNLERSMQKGTYISTSTYGAPSYDAATF